LIESMKGETKISMKWRDYEIVICSIISMKVKTATSYQIKRYTKLSKNKKQKSLTHMAFCTLQMLSSYGIMPTNILKIQDIH